MAEPSVEGEVERLVTKSSARATAEADEAAAFVVFRLGSNRFRFVFRGVSKSFSNLCFECFQFLSNLCFVVPTCLETFSARVSR